MKKLILFTVIYSILSIYANAQGYKIKVKIKGCESQQIILGHHKNSNLIPDDTIVTDNKGYGIFQGKKPLKQGMYFVFLPTKTYFDFILGVDQDFLLENDTSNIIKNLKVTGSDEIQLFIDYQKFLIEQNEKMTNLKDKYQKETNSESKKEIENEMTKISNSFETYYNNLVTNYPNFFFTKFIKATREVVVPESIIDRNAKYFYYKNHYFDNFDVSDIRLLYTPIYENKINNYLDKVIIQDPDTIIKALDYLLLNTENDSELYQYMLINLFNKYAKSQLMIAENIYVHLGEIYVEKAHWSADSFKNDLKTKIVRKKNCLVGKQAKQLQMTFLPITEADINELRIPLETMKSKGLEIEKDKSRTFEQKVPDLSELIADYMSSFTKSMELYDVKAKYTILWFMSPDCSHCKKETPLFYKEYIEKLKDKDVQVWAVFLEGNTDNWNKFSNEISDWFDFIIKHQMYEWNNVWNPFDNYRFKYDISSSPILFLLDKDKKIIAKRIGYEQAVEIILELEKTEK